MLVADNAGKLYSLEGNKFDKGLGESTYGSSLLESRSVLIEASLLLKSIVTLLIT